MPSHHRRILLLCLTLALPALAGCEKRPPLSDSVRAAREALVDTIATPRDSVPEWVADFYRGRADDPAWFDDHGPREEAGPAITALLTLAEHGLDPHAFASESLLAHGIAKRARDPVRVRELPRLGREDVELTTALVRGALAVSVGRVDAASLDPDWNVAGRRAHVLRRLRAQLAHGMPPESLTAYAPQDTDYVRLQRAYARLHRATKGASPDRGRLQTLALNLERRRWVAYERETPRLEVNIADYRVAWHGAEDSTRVFRVVVGDSLHQTPLFSDAVQWLDVHPSWRLGRRIVAEEIGPAQKRDAGYLARHDMEVMRTDVKGLPVVSPDAVPWDSARTNGRFPYLVRQRPGAKNPLGKVKFACPNEFDVYLHDTNARRLFQRERRALSHGCIRVAQPESLAALLLAATKWAPRDSLARLFADTTSRRVNLPRPVPVDFLYWTAWVDPAGELHVRDDLYGFDRRLAGYLRSRERAPFVLNPEVDWRAPKPGRKPAADSVRVATARASTAEP